MFTTVTVVDTIRIPPNMLSIPSMTAVHSQMDQRYPNKVLMDIGLIICRYGDCLKIGDGICVQGEPGAHHECLVKLVIFRPFVDEVCTGRIKKSTPDGIQVSLGFFQDIFIPPYWMLRPSKYEASTGLWVWTPNYDEGEDDDEEGADNSTADPDPDGRGGEGGDDGEDDNRYEMGIGSEIRFKVKSINFTQVTNTAKGMQATTTTTSQAQAAIHPNQMAAAASNKSSSEQTSESADATRPQPVRKRSVSVDLTESANLPATMHVVASICEDGLGLTSWWAQEEEEDEEEGEEEAAS